MNKLFHFLLLHDIHLYYMIYFLFFLNHNLKMILEEVINILNCHRINFEFLESMLIIGCHILNMCCLLKKKMILCRIFLMLMFLLWNDVRLVFLMLCKINTKYGNFGFLLYDFFLHFLTFFFSFDFNLSNVILIFK
jgi:hypothetical protein